MNDASVQCSIITHSLRPYPACFISIPPNAVYEPVIINYPKKKTQCSFIEDCEFTRTRDVGIQTYSLEDVKNKHHGRSVRAASTQYLSQSVEAIEAFVVEAGITMSNEDLKRFLMFLQQLNEESLLTLRKLCLKETIRNVDALLAFSNYQLRVLEIVLAKAMTKFEKEKAVFLAKLNQSNKFLLQVPLAASILPNIPLAKLIQYAIEKGAKNKEKRRSAVEKFKKLVRFVLINRQWLSTLNRKRKRELPAQYRDQQEEERIRYNAKKAIVLFDKHQYKAEWSSLLLSGAHRKILGKLPSVRTHEEIKMLDRIVVNIAKLNAFPKHIRKHIAQLLELVVYDKGREIVREGHDAIGFYIIISGGCDVLFNDLDGILKIDELQVGDTFGTNSFNKDGKTPNTVITNQLTELIMVTPDEIESFSENLRKAEYEDAYMFVSNWLPFKYWSWNQHHFNTFITNTTYLRFTKCDIVYGNSKQPSETIYFILKGNVELVRLLRIPAGETNRLKLYRICTLEAQNYFGLDDETSVDTWYVAKNDVNILTISLDNFKRIHPYSEFLLLKLKEDFKFWIPSVEQEIKSYKEIVEWNRFVKKTQKALFS